MSSSVHLVSLLWYFLLLINSASRLRYISGQCWDVPFLPSITSFGKMQVAGTFWSILPILSPEASGVYCAKAKA